jgi:hypothetical protein
MDKGKRVAKGADSGKAVTKNIKKTNPLNSGDSDEEIISKKPSAPVKKEDRHEDNSEIQVKKEDPKKEINSKSKPATDSDKKETTQSRSTAATRQVRESDDEDEEDDIPIAKAPTKQETKSPPRSNNQSARNTGNKAVLNLPSMLMTDPEGKMAVLSWIKEKFKLNAEGKVDGKSWVFELPSEHFSSWEKITTLLDDLIIHPDMPYDSPWEGNIKLPGEENYVDFNMEQNDRSDWRLTIEYETSAEKKNIGTFYDEKKHTFYPVSK